MRPYLILAALLFLMTGCTSYQSKYPYAIADFKPELRKHLEKIVQHGGGCDDDDDSTFRYLTEKVSYIDLEKLTLSEHPLLRAAAFSAICNKDVIPEPTTARDEYDPQGDSIMDANRRANSPIIDKVLLNHLDDTAIITYCAGEWGNQYFYVSDYYLVQSMRKTKISRIKLADEVLRHHYYLSCALDFIGNDPQDSGKYYGAIKQIANRNKFFNNYHEFRVLSILSAYKKPGDVPFIAERLSRIWGNQNEGAFDLIRKNPDTAYFKIFEKYYHILSRSRTQNDLFLAFNGTRWKMQGNYESFLGALLAYKNKRSAAIAKDIVKRQLYPPGGSLRKGANEHMIYFLLKKNECPEYASLINELKGEPKRLQENTQIQSLLRLSLPLP